MLSKKELKYQQKQSADIPLRHLLVEALRVTYWLETEESSVGDRLLSSSDDQVADGVPRPRLGSTCNTGLSLRPLLSLYL